MLHSDHNDQPSLDTAFYGEKLVERFAQAIARCKPPKAYGLHGRWGMGKTSFLCQLHHRIANTCALYPEQKYNELPEFTHVRVVWFEAWRYQNEANPIAALLHEIRQQLSWQQKLTGEVGKLGEVGIHSALTQIDAITKAIGVSPKAIKETGEAWERDHYASTLPTYTLRALLEEAIDKLLPAKPAKKNQGPKPRMLILIDDLDRCEPQTAYRLLEGLKIYLNLSNGVYVLGMDQRVIERAIASQLKDSKEPLSATSMAKEYLEKICQDIYHLPVQVPAKRLTFFIGLLREFTAPNSRLDQLEEILTAYPCLPANPRKLKAFANVVSYFLGDWDFQDWSNVELSGGRATGQQNFDRHSTILLLLASLYYFHHELYLLLQGNPGFYSDQLLKYARNGKADGLHEVFQQVVLADKSTDDPNAPVGASATLADAHASPIDSDVFRIQALVRDLGELTRDELNYFLQAD